MSGSVREAPGVFFRVETRVQTRARPNNLPSEWQNLSYRFAVGSLGITVHNTHVIYIDVLTASERTHWQGTIVVARAVGYRRHMCPGLHHKTGILTVVWQQRASWRVLYSLHQYPSIYKCQSKVAAVMDTGSVTSPPQISPTSVFWHTNSRYTSTHVFRHNTHKYWPP